MPRIDNRPSNQLRPLTITPNIAPNASGSVLISTGSTQVICSAMIEDGVPRWMKEQGVTGGWITAEYSMLPYSTLQRKARDIARGKLDGRSSEIQRLIGRSLRAVVDLEAIGARTIWVDCDVLQADGGTRTASITGASIAVCLACKKLIDEKKLAKLPIKQLVAAVSVGIVNGEALLDLNYEEDKSAEVDFNLVMTEDLQFVEVQGAGEESTFSQEQFFKLIEVGKEGISQLIARQKEFLG